MTFKADMPLRTSQLGKVDKQNGPAGVPCKVSVQESSHQKTSCLCAWEDLQIRIRGRRRHSECYCLMISKNISHVHQPKVHDSFIVKHEGDRFQLFPPAIQHFSWKQTPITGPATNIYRFSLLVMPGVQSRPITPVFLFKTLIGQSLINLLLEILVAHQ